MSETIYFQFCIRTAAKIAVYLILGESSFNIVDVQVSKDLASYTRTVYCGFMQRELQLNYVIVTRKSRVCISKNLLFCFLFYFIQIKWVEFSIF